MNVNSRLSQLERATAGTVAPGCPGCGQRPLVVHRFDDPPTPDRCANCGRAVPELPDGTIVLCYVENRAAERSDL